MIRTKLIYDGAEIFINPYTVSYVLRQDHENVIAFTNGHTLSVTMSIPELLKEIENETKCTCNGCKDSIPSKEN